MLFWESPIRPRDSTGPLNPFSENVLSKCLGFFLLHINSPKVHESAWYLATVGNLLSLHLVYTLGVLISRPMDSQGLSLPNASFSERHCEAIVFYDHVDGRQPLHLKSIAAIFQYGLELPIRIRNTIPKR